jgi:hypothetical protein
MARGSSFIASKIGCSPETLRKWMHQSEIYTAAALDTSSWSPSRLAQRGENLLVGGDFEGIVKHPHNFIENNPLYGSSGMQVSNLAKFEYS